MLSLRREISPFVGIDNYAKKTRGQYTVHSIYFDTFMFDFYYQKEAGIRQRKKIRIRGYNGQNGRSLAFLEIKEKDNMVVSKIRAPFLFKNIQTLCNHGDVERFILNGNGLTQAVDDARRFFYNVIRYSLQPKILIRYEREAFIGKFNPCLRLTFDKNIRSFSYPSLEDLFSDNRTISSLPKHFIFEVKFHCEIFSMPKWLRDILEDHNLNWQALSKYKICLDSHHIPQGSHRSSSVSFLNSHYNLI